MSLGFMSVVSMISSTAQCFDGLGDSIVKYSKEKCSGPTALALHGRYSRVHSKRGVQAYKSSY
jgi:hypothetical protein